MKKIYFLSFLLTCAFANAQLLTDDFNYADNALLTANGWTAHSGTGTNSIDVGASNGLLYTGYNTLAGNAAQLDNTGEDVNKTFSAPVTTGSIYYSFLVKINTAVDGYFAHLGSGTTFVGKVFTKPSTTTGKVNFGIANSNTASYSTTDFDLGATYLIIVKYDVSTTGALSLWVKSSGVPATEAAAGTADATASGSGSATVGGFYLRQYSATQNIVVDEVKVYTTWFGATPCSLSLGAETTLCDAITLNIDTYTATIPFTGGASGTYNLSTSAGTIGGDNPSTTAAGNITISNIPEGTTVTLTVTGSCGLTKTVASPECKPINALPLVENFNYTANAALGAQQTWTNRNSGDNINVTSGNLNYTGITSTGNSVSFTGAGAECHTPFTATTVTEGTLYTSFLMNVSDYANVTTDGTQTYFAILTDGNPANFKARLFIKKAAAQYQLGLTSGTSTTNYAATLFNVGDVVYVILGYDFNSNTLKAWFNPTVATFNDTTTPDLTDTPATAITTLGGFLLRQDADNSTPSIQIDELRVALTIPALAVNNNTIAGLAVYPNPVKNGVFYINTEANTTKSVRVYDMIGKEVINTTTTDAVNVSGLNKGLYLVQITENGNTAVKKLIIE
ncbi:T9SS type A sorting domain-containing protein [Flavobacterium stagni]|uniref:T9SS type A sorting domain-containing protein n=1 Tax=Flavobacterium stagni TaxID=2506421 RepID=A0A4Q1KCG7_9FLAO|nr:T9SS type A sorting domain-containing protein [Flavobacterium stagni]RXR24617.1 T9SS type A sorting domain-containing protein [Flavobacterium stagni]